MRITRKRVAVLAVSVLVAGVVAGLGLVGSAPEPAVAHGAQLFPGSRQYFCWVDGLQDNGQIIPTNPACVDAVNQHGTNTSYNWFANLHPSAAGRTVGFIPDGRLCDGGGGGPFDFEPYNMMRDDWPITHLTAGASYEFRHNNWAAHPGRFDVYVTEQGWDPSAPLAWSDLELVDTVTDPPQSGGPGGLNYYYWDVEFPSNRTGRHLVFTHWVRSDSPENFYSCSDIVFDGGNGEVTGLNPPSGSTTSTSSTSSTSTSSSSTSSTSSTSTTSTTMPAGGCMVTYGIVSQWNDAFQGQVTVMNHNTSAVDGWELTWSYANGQQITQLWGGIDEQVGSAVSVSNESWNATIAVDGSVAFGFLANWSGTNARPTAFSLNGTACTVT